MDNLLRPLRQRSFALLWGATLLSNLGFWIQDITLGWLIAGLTTSPAQVALVPAAAMLPMFLFSLPAGALGDAVDRRTFLLLMQAGVVILLLLFAAAVALDRITIGGILLFALVSGTINAFAGPSRQAVLPSLVPAADVRGAVMLSAIGYNGSRAVGPMIGGFILASFGALAAILTYMASCVAVGAAILAWRQPPIAKKAKTPVLANMIDGLRYVFQRRELRGALLTTGLYFVAVSPLWAFAPLVAKRFADGDSSIFGLFMMSIGAGAVLGGFSKRLAGTRGFDRSLALGSTLSAVALALIAAADQIGWSLLGCFIAGLGWIGVSASINSFMLVEAEPTFRARAIAVVMIVFSGGLALGSLLWGQVGRLIGIGPAFAFGAAALAAVAIWAMVRARQSEQPVRLSGTSD